MAGEMVKLGESTRFTPYRKEDVIKKEEELHEGI